MSIEQTPVLNRVKSIINRLDPTTRGDFLELTKEVKAELKDLKGKLKDEFEARLGKDAEPSSAKVDYERADAAIDHVTKEGEPAPALPSAPAPVEVLDPAPAQPQG